MFSTKIQALKQPFDRHLAALIANPPEQSTTMTITPSMASDMLAYNTRNRHVAQAVLKQYVGQMKLGQWRYTRVPIIFSTERLIDGQHRLEACVEAQVSIVADVVFGADDAAFAFIDVGKRRTTGDIFSINGVPHANSIAAATKWLWKYNDNRYMGHGGGNFLSAAQTYDYFLTLDGLHASINIGRTVGHSKIAPGAMMAAIHYLCANKNRALADQFFDILASGFGASGKLDPPFVLRNKLIANLATETRYSSQAIGALTINAWNMYRTNRSGRGLKIDRDKPFPRVA